MKILFDYFPIILFFLAFKVYDIYVATVVALGATALQIGFYWLKYRRFALVHLITFGVLLVMGGITLLVKDPIFIKWKPTVLSWVLALVCLFSMVFTKKTFLQYLLDKKITLPRQVWNKLNASWIVFFLLMGAANLYVVYHYDTNTWVNFKLFGFMGATLVFSILQSLYLAKYLVLPQSSPSASLSVPATFADSVDGDSVDGSVALAGEAIKATGEDSVQEGSAEGAK